jgi:uncharacterized membrane protein YfhO
LNSDFDPVHKRFKMAATFDYQPKPGVNLGGNVGLNDLTWVIKTNGNFAIYEFDGALPRYKLYTQWQKAVDDASSLTNLSSLTFEPSQQLLVNDSEVTASSGSATNSGTVKVLSYSPKKIKAEANAAAPSILLWNDRWAPNWKAFVDGQPVKLLRCNFIMRGIQVPAGSHQIEMRYEQPTTMLWVTLATAGVGVLIVAFLAVDGRKAR